MELLSVVLTPVLGYFIPIDDTNIKNAVSYFVSSILIWIYTRASSWSYVRFIWNYIFVERSIVISDSNPVFFKLMDFYHQNYAEKIKECDLKTEYGRNKLIINMFCTNSLTEEFKDECTGKKYLINIGLGTRSSSNNKTEIKQIKISSKCPVNILERYIDKTVERFNYKVCNKLPVYTLDIDQSEKKRTLRWKSRVIKLSKNMENTIVSDDLNNNFYKDIARFMDGEDEYVRKGLPYKRGYVLYGKPGTGKTSLIKAIANSYQTPIFIVDMEFINTNDELVKVISDISVNVASGQKYILVFEDIDRTSLFDRYSQRVSENCFLNVLDGIDEGYGRITIITCNTVHVLKEMKALIRPGRIDKMIEVSLCDHDQVMKFLSFHYPDTDFNFTIRKNIVISPAMLIQIITVMENPSSVEEILNNHLDFRDFDISLAQTKYNIQSIKITSSITKSDLKSKSEPTNLNHNDSDSEDSHFSNLKRKYEKKYSSNRERIMALETENTLLEMLKEKGELGSEEEFLMEKNKYMIKKITRQMDTDRRVIGKRLAARKCYQINIIDLIKQLEQGVVDEENEVCPYELSGGETDQEPERKSNRIIKKKRIKKSCIKKKSTTNTENTEFEHDNDDNYSLDKITLDSVMNDDFDLCFDDTEIKCDNNGIDHDDNNVHQGNKVNTDLVMIN